MHRSMAVSVSTLRRVSRGQRLFPSTDPLQGFRCWSAGADGRSYYAHRRWKREQNEAHYHTSVTNILPTDVLCAHTRLVSACLACTRAHIRRPEACTRKCVRINKGRETWTRGRLVINLGSSKWTRSWAALQGVSGFFHQVTLEVSERARVPWSSTLLLRMATQTISLF